MSSGIRLQNHKKVILFPPPELWTFYDFGDGATNYIQEWHGALSERAQFALNDLLKSNRKIENPRDWYGYRAFSEGKLQKFRLWELKFRADKLQHRIIGICGRQRKQAIFLIGCHHKMNVYTPRDALRTACRRSVSYWNNEATLHERKVRTDP